MSLCEELDTYQSQVSGHLAVLRRAGLVAATRSGYFNVYRVDSRTLDLLFERLCDLSRRSSWLRDNPCSERCAPSRG
jgi:DNA-binding transcriptional ArsR family regulator